MYPLKKNKEGEKEEKALVMGQTAVSVFSGKRFSCSKLIGKIPLSYLEELIQLLKSIWVVKTIITS